MHKLDQYESKKARAVDVRGKLFAFEKLDPERSALIVVDMQNVFCAKGQVVEVPEARSIVANINELATAFRGRGIPVIWLQQTYDQDMDDGWNLWFDVMAPGERKDAIVKAMSRGTEGHELYPELNVQEGDIKVCKHQYSAFAPNSSMLDSILRKRGIDTIVIAGTLTNVCCESTARDAFFLNYKIVFLSDGTACLSDEEHNATLVSIHNFFGDVRSSSDVVQALQSNSAAFPVSR
jgi:ureidoacrylate peracid hydrolase